MSLSVAHLAALLDRVAQAYDACHRFVDADVNSDDLAWGEYSHSNTQPVHGGLAIYPYRSTEDPGHFFLLGYEYQSRWSAHTQVQAQQAHATLQAAALDLATTIGAIPLFHFPGFQLRIAFTGHAGKKRRLILHLDHTRVHTDPLLVPALAKRLHAILAQLHNIPATGPFVPFIVEHAITVHAPGPVEALIKAVVFQTGHLPSPPCTAFYSIAQVLDTAHMDADLTALLNAGGIPPG